jgi:hypothetical protein
MQKIPVCILLQSSQEDTEQFRLLLKYLYNSYILDNSGTGKIVNYKKIELLNILFFLYSNLFFPSPHSTLSIKLPFFLDKFKNIEFYFSSNFELPCRKFDNSIRKLFSYLDLSIIIKIVFKLLSEKSVILLSSDASILKTIIPAIHSLIFPLSWIYLYLPVVPENKKDSLLESPTQYFFGIAGNTKDNIINIVKKEFVVDCDTNEIFSDKKFVDFCPLPCSEFLGKRPYLTIHNKCLKKIDPKTQDISHVTFLKEGRVIIDCDDENRLVTEHEDQYLSPAESVKLREEIQKLKKRSFNRTNVDLFNSNINIVQENHCERSFDYKMKKIFTKLIVDKFKENDDLYEDIKTFNSFHEYDITTEFENDSPKQIVKNVFQTEEGDSKRSFENSFKININVKSFKDNKVNSSYFNFNPKLFKDYLEIVHQLQTKNYTSMTSPGESPNSHQHQINFYGEDGVINIAKQLEKEIQNMEYFIEEVYSSQILLSIVNNNKGKSNKQYAISFEDQNNLEEKHQYYNYLGKLFYELYKTNLTIQIDEDDDRSDFLLNNMIYNFEKGFSLKEDEFPFFAFHSILKEIPKNKLQIISAKLFSCQKLKDVCEEIINEKERNERELKTRKEARDKHKKEREERNRKERKNNIHNNK